MNPRLLSTLATVVIFFSAFTVARVHGQSPARPNIVLLMGDDHGWDETAYNGHPHLKTPVLDELARTGLRMNRFYAGGSSCSPTRATIITGRHHLRSGVFNPGWSTRPEEIGIAKILKQAGYATGHFGKWHIGAVKADSPTNPRAMGFDTYLSHDNFFELDPWFSRNGAPPVQFKGESSEILVAEAIRFINEAKQAGKPFFVVVWFGSPHEPYQALPKDLALYDNLPKELGNKQVSLTSNETGLPVQRLQRDVLRERYAEITAMDRSIGQLRDHLRREQLRDNTLLWYCGDNGTPQEAVATVPFRAHKGAVYEGGIRVPSVLEWPARIRQPRATDVNTVTSDMFSTLCELAGQPLPKRPIDGVSLVSLFDGRMTTRGTPIGFWNGDNREDPKGPPYISPAQQEGTTPLVKKDPTGLATRNFLNVKHPTIQPRDFDGARAWLDDRFKLVVGAAGNMSQELFDVRADPAEKTNVIKEHPDVAAKMAQQLRAWQQSVLESLTGADYR
jgi:arylsulfatase A-like enzyme